MKYLASKIRRNREIFIGGRNEIFENRGSCRSPHREGKSHINSPHEIDENHHPTSIINRRKLYRRREIPLDKSGRKIFHPLTGNEETDYVSINLSAFYNNGPRRKSATTTTVKLEANRSIEKPTISISLYGEMF